MKTFRIAFAGAVVALFATAAGAQVVFTARNPNTLTNYEGVGPFASVEARLAARPLPFPTYAPTAMGQMNGRRATNPVATPGQAPSAEALAAAATRFAAERAVVVPGVPAGATPGSPPTAGTQEGANFLPSPGLYTQYCENCDAVNYNYPQVAIGKLFFNMVGGSASCSATMIGDRLLVTAAHCCYDTTNAQMNTDFTFAPAYRNGVAPFGAWTYTFARVLSTYRTAPGRGNDICLIRLGTDAGGHYPSYYTGWLGTAVGFDYLQNAHAIGYPGNIGGGEYMELCTSQTNHPSVGCNRLNTMNMGCSMTYGASGGPWVLRYRDATPVNGNFVFGVVSGWDSASCTGTFGEAFNGPRFNTGNFTALCNAGGWC